MSWGRPARPAHPTPKGIPSSVTLHELVLLQHFAAQAGTVLEVGTHLGFSCVGMALAGAHVTSVDPHFEGPADAPDTWEPFLANVERHGLPLVAPLLDHLGAGVGDGVGRVYALRLPVEAAPLYDYSCWGMAFIDGDHVWPCPLRDARIAIAHLQAPGYLAFHDVTAHWPGVLRTVVELEKEGAMREVGREGTLRVYQVSASSVNGSSRTPTTSR